MALNVEAVKAEGLEIDIERYAREGLAELTPAGRYRMKMHGLCTQKHEGYFMLRIRIPAGALSADQADVLAGVGDRYGRGWLHLTTRSDVELHWVTLPAFLEIRSQLEAAGITTRSACGHTVRNIMACTGSGRCAGSKLDMAPLARAISENFVSKGPMNNRRLPRRINVYVAGCEACAGHAKINDMGLVAVLDGDKLAGFDVYAGGSMGSSPFIGRLVAERVPLEDAVAVADAVAEIYMTHWDGSKGAKARMKFLVQEWGVERFAAELARVLPEHRTKVAPLDFGPEALFRPRAESGPAACSGATAPGILPEGGAGTHRVVVRVPVGEIAAAQFRKLAALAREHGDGSMRLTREQNVEVVGIPPWKLRAALQGIAATGLSTVGGGSLLDVQACVGTTFCSLAITNAQGAGGELVQHLDARGARHDMRIHISGCMNSCALHQVADIGFSGIKVSDGEGKGEGYQLYLGGRLHGDPVVGALTGVRVPEGELVGVVSALLDRYEAERLDGETFHDYAQRAGVESLAEHARALLPQAREPAAVSR